MNEETLMLLDSIVAVLESLSAQKKSIIERDKNGRIIGVKTMQVENEHESEKTHSVCNQ